MYVKFFLWPGMRAKGFPSSHEKMGHFLIPMKKLLRMPYFRIRKYGAGLH